VFTVPTSRVALSSAVDSFLDALPRTTVLDRINDTEASSTFWHARIATKLARLSTRILCFTLLSCIGRD